MGLDQRNEKMRVELQLYEVLVSNSTTILLNSNTVDYIGSIVADFGAKKFIKVALLHSPGSSGLDAR